jgi:hypothetical protein
MRREETTMMQRTGKRAATMAVRVAEVRMLRWQAAEILEECLDMTRTLVRMGEESGWADPRIGLLDLEIRRYEEIREGLLDRAQRLELSHVA